MDSYSKKRGNHTGTAKENAYLTHNPATNLPVRVTWASRAWNDGPEPKYFARNNSTAMSIEYVMNGAIDVEQDGRKFHVLSDTVAILRLGAAQRFRFSGAAYNEKIYLVAGGDVAAQIISSLPTVVTPPQGSPIKRMFQDVFEQVKTFDLEATLRASELTYGILVRLSECAALQRNQPTEIEPLQDAISFMHLRRELV